MDTKTRDQIFHTTSRLVSDLLTQSNSEVQHQLDSFDRLLNINIPQILQETEFKIRNYQSKIVHSFKLQNPITDRPTLNDGTVLLPQAAKLRNLTYEGAIYVDVVHSIYTNCKLNPPKKKGKICLEYVNLEEENIDDLKDFSTEDEQMGPCSYQKLYTRVLLCKLPIMVKSNRCHLSDLSTFFSNASLPTYALTTNSSFCEASTKTLPALAKSSTDLKNSSSVATTTFPKNNLEGLKKEMCNDLYMGGYFIIKGQEKTVLIQERMRYMHSCVTAAPKTPACQKFSLCSEIRSCNESKIKASSTLKMYISKPTKDSGINVFVQIPFLKKNQKTLLPIPLSWCFRLLGVTSAAEMHNLLMGPMPLAHIVPPLKKPNSLGANTNADADAAHKGAGQQQNVMHEHWQKFNVLARDISQGSTASTGAKKKNNAIPSPTWISFKEIIETLTNQILYLAKHEILPHIGVDESASTLRKKQIRLAEMARELLLSHLKFIPVPSREHMVQKRFETSGLLIALMFRQLFVVDMKQFTLQTFKAIDKFEKKRHNDINKKIDDDANFSATPLEHHDIDFDIRALFYRPAIADGLKYAIVTGNWGKSKGASNSQQGVSQQLRRETPMATQSHLKRVQIPINRDAKSSEARALQGSQFGILCPAETPEGKICGLMKQLSWGVHVNIGMTRKELCAIVDTIQSQLKLMNILDQRSTVIETHAHGAVNKGIYVYVNGSPEYQFVPTLEFGVSEILEELRLYRQMGVFPFYVSIYQQSYFGTCNIHITSHVGNFCRPIFHANKLKHAIAHALGKNLNCKCPMSKFNVFCTALANELKPTADDCNNKRAHYRHLQSSVVTNKKGTIKMSDQECRLSWHDLLRHGIIQYVDKNEEMSIKVAKDCTDIFPREGLSVTATHMEIAPWLYLGAMASLIPFIDHDQAVRAIFQCSHGKAAVGISSFGFQKATHAIHHQLWYPQTPLVYTDAERISKLVDLPTAANPIVAVNFEKGYNPEDAIILNKASMDRGLFRSSLTNTYPYEDSKNDSLRLGSLKGKSKSSSNKTGSLDKQIKNSDVDPSRNLDVDGLPVAGSSIKYNDNLLEQIDYSAGSVDPETGAIRTKPVPYKGKGATIHLAQAYGPANKRSDVDEFKVQREALAKYGTRGSGRGKDGILFDYNEPASRVERVFLTNSDAIQKEESKDADADADASTNLMRERVPRTRTSLVSLTVPRIPMVGDKFSSRHGQKGVTSLLVSQEDMPWTVEGIVPDLIINPHAFPSRMSVGQLLESLIGKAAACTGTQGDGTPHVGEGDGNVIEAEAALLAAGYEKSGKEVMYCGETGRRLKCSIFIGPVNYQRLTHQATEKIHARARGPIEPTTGQPTAKRTKNGAVRNGEMERDQLVAHGSTMITKDRMCNESDQTSVQICKDCGLMISSFRLDNAFDHKEARSMKYMQPQEDPKWDIARRSELYGVDMTKLVCPKCKQHGANVTTASIPKAFCALSHELLSMGIDLTFNMASKSNDVKK